MHPQLLAWYSTGKQHFIGVKLLSWASLICCSTSVCGAGAVMGCICPSPAADDAIASDKCDHTVFMIARNHIISLFYHHNVMFSMFFVINFLMVHVTL